MNDKPLDRTKADRLVSELISHPDSFEKKGLANELLNQFFHGYPLDQLRSLLHHHDDRVLRQGSWIASELASEAEALLNDMILISTHPDRRIRRDALIVIMLGTLGARSEEFFRLVEGLDDLDAAVSEHALILLSRASEGQLAAAIKHFASTETDSRHLPWLRMLIDAHCASSAKIEAMFQGEDPLRRKYALALAERIYPADPNPLNLAARNKDVSIKRLADHFLQLHKIKRPTTKDDAKELLKSLKKVEDGNTN